MSWCPGAVRFAVLVNPANPNIEDRNVNVETAARAMEVQIQVHNAGTIREIEAVFATMAREQSDVLLASPDPSPVPGVFNWSSWRLTTEFPPHILCATMSKPVGS